MKNILVTGGCGFLGSHLLRLLRRSRGDLNIINVDCLSYCGSLNNCKDVPNIKFIKMNIADPNIENVFKEHKIDTVVSLAAQTHVDRSIRFPREFVETDLIGIFNLAYFSLKNDVKLFLQVSTDEVYGDEYQGEASEDFPLKPNSPYAASKAAADLLLLSYYKTYNLPLIIVRPCNNFGISQFVEKLIPMTIMRLFNGEPAILHGKGNEIREWIAVEDCTKIIYEILKYGKIGEIYNIGSGQRLRNIDVIRKIILLIMKSKQYYKYIRKVGNRPGNDKRYAINNEKMGKLLGGRYIFNSLDDNLKDIIDWYAVHQDWYRDVDISANLYKTNEDYLR